jgi:hydroxymethylpyrimidine pyrophosphatase-like HAD family hydrolase
MYCRVLACDFDGTGATNGQLAPELAAALGEARARGVVTLLVTGRVREDVEALCADLSMFDAVVAENGAIICLPQWKRTIQLGQPPSAELLSALRARGVPFHAGAVVVGTWERHAPDLFALVRQQGIDGQIVFNREAVMLLPTGINKASGIQRALEELGRSEHNLVAFGDAENDLPLFAVAELAVAARGAIPAVARQAEDALSQPNGAGVARYVHQLLRDGCRLPTPSRHCLLLGADASGASVELPATGQHVLVSGDPRSGKSWLTGLVAERLFERNYRFCLIDPEGDHAALAQRPRILTLGRDVPLPEPAALPRLTADHGLSLVLVLAALSQHAQRAYVENAVRALEGDSDITGLPHWILVDEAQYFFGKSTKCPVRFDGGVTYLFSTYRPSLLANSVHAAIGAHVVARTMVDDERYFISGVLQARGPRDIVPFEVLSGIEPPRAGLLLQTPGGPRWSTFNPAARVTTHAHHARKYADLRVPEDRAFWFGSGAGQPGPVAHNIAEFHRAVQTLPAAVLRQHLTAEDFSRWAADVLGDDDLARAFGKLERTVRHGAPASAGELLAHIEDRYDLRPERG